MKRLLGILFLLFLYSSLLVTVPASGQESVGLADTPWPMYQHDAQHTGRSPFVGIMHQPVLLWKESLGLSQDMGGIVIDQDGNLLIADGMKLTRYDPIQRQPIWQFLFSHSRSIPLLASDGYMYLGKWNEFFQLTPDGQLGWIVLLNANLVFASNAVFGPDGNVYVGHDALWSFTQQGDLNWVYGFDWFSHTSPAVGSDGIIYAGGGAVYDICAWRANGTQYWCQDMPHHAEDAAPSIAANGNIILASDEGSLYSIYPSGQVDWEFETEWVGTNAPSIEAAIGPDESIYFTINLQETLDGYLYAIDGDGEFKWRIYLPYNDASNQRAWLYRPPVTDRLGNVYICAGNMRCYGFAADGSESWQFEYPMEDSIVITAGMAPLIADEGLMLIMDSLNVLHAYADPEIYPLLFTDTQVVDYQVDLGAAPFTAIIPIDSTILPLNYSATVTDVPWLTIHSTSGVTPDNLELEFHPAAISVPGIYRAEVQVRSSDRIGWTVVIPVVLNVSVTQTFLPMINRDTGHYQLIYHSDWYGDGQLVTNQIDGDPRNVIFDDLPVPVQGVYYSQDARRAAVVYWPDFNKSDQNLLVLDTVTQQSIFEIPFSEDGPTWLSWSPDGTKFVLDYHPEELEYTELFIVDMNGRMSRLTYTVHFDQHPFWSPTGEWIAFSHDTNVNLIRPDGSDLHTLPIDLQSDYPAGWSPDGRYLLIIVPPRYPIPNELWVYDLQTSDYWRIAQSLDLPETTLPAFSPDGTLIAYVGYRNYLDEVMVTNLTGSETITITPEPGDYRQISWSPDGHWISYVSYYTRIDLSQHLDYDVFVVRKDGSSNHIITSNIRWDRFPAWQK